MLARQLSDFQIIKKILRELKNTFTQPTLAVTINVC